MHDKKKGKSKKTPEQEALEKRVDAMMDPKRPDGSLPEDVALKAEDALPPEDSAPAASADPGPVIAENTTAAKTAPQLSPKLRKKIAVDEPAKSSGPDPISIDKLDELTKEIVGSKPKAAKLKKTEEQEEQKDGQDEPEQDTTDDANGEPESREAPEETEVDEQEVSPAEPAPEDDITDQSTELDDVRTDEAVDDIVAYEGDVMLAVADSTAAERNRQAATAGGKKGRHGAFSTIFWLLIFLIVIAAIVLGWLLITGGNVSGLPGR